MRCQRPENRLIQLQTLPVCRALICMAAGFLFWHSIAMAGTGLNTAVVVSQKIKPYLQVVEGIIKEAGGSPNTVEAFYLMPRNISGNQGLVETLGRSEYDMVVAVGPEAASLVWGADLNVDKLYTAILDTANIPEMNKDACGISLRIPVADQLTSIVSSLPSLRKLGLLFDPTHNQWFFDAAKKASETLGIEIMPIEVTRRNQITRVWTGKDVEAIWMIPDQTIISEKIIQFVIKEGVYRNTGVIGYNSFFLRSGAVFSFEFDYRELGRQTGFKILEVGRGNGCMPEPPVFNTVVNRKIAEKIGMEVTP